MTERNWTPGPYQPVFAGINKEDDVWELQWSRDGECVAEFVHGKAEAYLLSEAPELYESLATIVFAMICDKHGMVIAGKVKDNGWQWPEDGPRYVDERLDNALQVMAKARGENYE